MAEITLYLADILPPERFPWPLLRQIPGEYRRRAEAAGSPALAGQALAVGGLLCLGLGLGPVDALRRGPEGKPCLPGGTPCISIAHGGGRAVLAVGDVEVGVDLEPPGLVRWAAAKRFFAPAELLELRAAPAEAQPSLFARFWTRLEAGLKLEGTGFALEGAFAHPADRPIHCRSFLDRGGWLTCATWTPAEIRLEEVALR